MITPDIRQKSLTWRLAGVIIMASNMASILQAKPRTELGKKVKALRRAGFLPAVVYGEGVPSQPISVPYKDFDKVFREAGESTLIKLRITNDELRKAQEFNVLIHDPARDPLKGQPLHVDFYAVRMDKTIRTKVPVEIIGESPAVKNLAGILIKVIQEIEVEALPRDLPHELKVDISGLAELESRLYVKDIPFSPGVKIHANQDDAVVIVESPRTEEELKALEEAPLVEAPAEVKTEREVKVAEEEKAVEGEGAEKIEKEASGTKEKK